MENRPFHNISFPISACFHNHRMKYFLHRGVESMGMYLNPFDGLSGTIARLLGGVEVSVDTNGFSNDLITFRNRDDVLTLLIHLGYLSYDPV